MWLFVLLGAPCESSRGPRNLLHIKNGHFGCFVNQNQPAHQFPSWADWQIFISSQNPKTSFESLKGWKSCVSLPPASKNWEDKEWGNEERRESENGEREGTVQMILMATLRPMAVNTLKHYSIKAAFLLGLSCYHLIQGDFQCTGN